MRTFPQAVPIVLSGGLSPAPRAGAFLAFDQLFGQRTGQGGTGRWGMHPAFNATNEFLDPATAEFPDGADRPIHEGATRALARRLYASGYQAVTIDTEYWWPKYPYKSGNSAFGQPVPDVRGYYPQTAQVIRWMRDECPSLRVAPYGNPPAGAYDPDDDDSQRAQLATYDEDARPLATLGDFVSLDLYNFDAPGRDSLWRRYAPVRIAQCRKYGKQVIAEMTIHPVGAEDLRLTRDPANLAAEIAVVRQYADGLVMWGNAASLTGALSDAIAGVIAMPPG
jgi:hypothetical protein